LEFNKNKKNSSLTTGLIIIIMMSLSYLPLDNGHTSALLLFSTEPVFAQLSGQVIFPYGEEQVSTDRTFNFFFLLLPNNGF
jgi:hypothetical protein